MPIKHLGVRGAWRATLSYGLAHFGKSLVWYASEILLGYYLTEICAIPGAQMGFILAAGLVCSALIDVAVGGALGAASPDLRGVCALQFRGAAASALAVLLLFMGAWAPPAIRLPYAVVASIAFRVAYAVYDIPQSTLLTLATASDEGRTRLSGLRYLFSGLASVMVGAIAPVLIGAETAAVRQWRFMAFGVALAAIALATSWPLTRAFPGPQFGGQGGEKRGRGAAWGRPTRKMPRDIAILIGIMFVISACGPVFSQLAPYLAAYVLKSPRFGGAILAAMAIGAILSQPGWTLVSRGRTRRLMMILTLMAMGASCLGFAGAIVWARWIGLVFALLFGAAGGGLGMVLWAAFGDAAGRSAKGGEALAYGLFTAASKLGLAAAALVLGGFLSAIDYRGVDRFDLLIAMAAAPLLGALACIVLLLAWRTASAPDRQAAPALL